ncbi:metalloregulator ArsR/SmtB family transcription factor [Leucobacter allii]|uniref:Metalloregulator ArsR/SmtB family transcription factor n=1 Tax=Leucobacter allii TaxID=2932247 RepID=A0ABY4FLN9_9MICO|nr:metalloregulator ArsR/SmtB family transcription factor [Leucobacter allii]UOQ57191.1 metalloregulator ArsR/SmtB family transcription factor [Leucobacter allii]
MHALDVLGDPVRRRILELVAGDEVPAGAIADAIASEFGISQPAVSQHLRVLRENGFMTVRPEGARRLYAVDPRGPQAASEWLSPFERFWRGPLAALGTELARGARQRRLTAAEAEPADADTELARPRDADAGDGMRPRTAGTEHHPESKER